MTTIDRRDALDERLLAELEPVRLALRADALAEAERRVAAAEADAEQATAAAQAAIDAEVEQARRKAAAAADARADAALTQARRTARADVLAARAELSRELAARVQSRLATAVDDPRYPRLIDHLVDLARSQLGDDAAIEHDPAGGFVATAGGRRVDYRLDALAERALAAAGDEVGSW